MEYFIKYGKQQKFSKFWNNWKQQKCSKFWIWKYLEYSKKNAKITLILKNLEYEIFHGIFLEYSKKQKAALGGVKFNQGKYYVTLALVWTCRAQSLCVLIIIYRKANINKTKNSSQPSKKIKSKFRELS